MTMVVGSRLIIHFYSKVPYNLRRSVFGFTSVLLNQILNHYSKSFGVMIVSIVVVVVIVVIIIIIIIIIIITIIIITIIIIITTLLTKKR